MLVEFTSSRWTGSKLGNVVTAFDGTSIFLCDEY